MPLALRNLLANKPRLLRSSGGIGFAVLLMLMQLGFERAFFNASLELIRRFDGDLFLESASKYRFATRDPFPSEALDKARGVPGVATVVAASMRIGTDVFWKNPSDGKNFLVRVLAFDPDHPVLRLPAVEGDLAALREPSAVLVDRRARRFMGMDRGAKEAALNGTPVHIVGSFALGPDFENDGTVVAGSKTFGQLLPNPRGGPPEVELGVVDARSGQRDRRRAEGARRRAARPDRGPDQAAAARIGAQISGRRVVGRTDLLRWGPWSASSSAC